MSDYFDTIDLVDWTDPDGGWDGDLHQCGHIHLRGQDCPPPDGPCGSFLCCIN